jgi:hypothetical protein
MRLGKAVVFIFFGWLAVAPALAVDTTFWQVGTFDNLLQGTLEGVSLTKDGQLTLAPAASAVFNPDETLALSLASDRRGGLYVGTGHQGKVFRVNAQMKGELFFTAQEPDIFALAAGPDGALYVGTSPEGKVYRVTADGKSQVFYDPKAHYIWALQFDRQGQLYVGTGDRGTIYKVDAAGKGKLFFDSKQTHIMCLTLDGSGNLLAGSFPNGLIYKINSDGKAFVLFQANMPEIHDLAVDSEGRIYAAALGGGPGRGAPMLVTPQNQGGADQGSVTTVTVTASTDGEGPEGAAAQQAPVRSSKQGQSFNRSLAPFGASGPKPPQGQGALIRILPDYSTETIWSSNKESIFGLALSGGRILFTTDENGRIFQINPSQDGQNLTLLTETHESLATRLIFEGKDLYVATGNIAKLIRLGSSNGPEGSYESPVKDSKFISKWGVLAWRGSVPDGASIEFFTRSGNSNRPDDTWSEWAGPYTEPEGSPIKSAPARYIQWKAEFKGSPKGSPVLDDVTVSYLNQNLPPQIRSLSVSTSDERTGSSAASSPSASLGSSGATVTVTTITSAPVNPGSAGGNAGPPSPTALNWQADDPNGDSLVYSLYVKAGDEMEWHLLKDELQQTSYTVDSDALADGRYVARLVASDENSNPPSTARQDELLSAPFWIDHTPPQVEMESQKAVAGGIEIRFRAEDETSPLKSAEVSTDGKDWHEVMADDGIVDSRTETFTVRLENPAPGEHVVTLRAYDTAGNPGLGKAVLPVPVEKAARR